MTEPPRARIEIVLRSLLVIALLYVFLVAIQTIGGTVKTLGLGQAEGLITRMPPIAALAVGILATVLVQSSSVTTSLIVGVVVAQPGATLEESIYAFVPMIMGANVGTTITNTLVSLGHVTRSAEFRRAFAGATVHDFFNLITVVILLPVELTTRILTRCAVWLVEILDLSTQVEFQSPVKSAVKAGYSVIKSFLQDVLGASGTVYAVLAVSTAVALIFICLTFITKNMKILMAQRLERAINAALQRSGLLGMGIGIVVTAAVQSSSITTSILVPMFGAGILSLRNGFPIMLGANIGTTVTALMAAVVKGNAGLAIAFVHLLFNVLGILLIYPAAAIREVPIRLAESLARRTTESRWWIVVYVGGAFVVAPLIGLLLFK